MMHKNVSDNAERNYNLFFKNLMTPYYEKKRRIHTNDKI